MSNQTKLDMANNQTERGSGLAGSSCSASPYSAKIDALTNSIKEIVNFREHLRGCAIDQTDFCTCGLKEALDAAVKAVNMPVPNAKSELPTERK